MKIVIVSYDTFYDALPDDVFEALRSKGYSFRDIYEDKKFRTNNDLIDALYKHGIDHGRVVGREHIRITNIPDNITDFTIISDDSDWGDGIEEVIYVVDGKLYKKYVLDDDEDEDVQRRYNL